ncbi:hypothetical protein GH733_015219 [Mirounga leonina]|nr:hypothetical protein GH733_015219 [Mirounga leonina]
MKVRRDSVESEEFEGRILQKGGCGMSKTEKERLSEENSGSEQDHGGRGGNVFKGCLCRMASLYPVPPLKGQAIISNSKLPCDEKRVHNSNEYFKLNEHGLNELLNSHGGQPYKNIFLIIHNPTNKTLNKVIEKLKK